MLQEIVDQHHIRDYQLKHYIIKHQVENIIRI